MIDLRCGDNREVLQAVADCSVDAVVCDPPYELGFMGRKWDSSGIAYDVGLWREVLRVLKPGGHLVAFGGTRTYHRMTCAIEDAGFDIRDCLGWLYGSGFPKSLDVSKAIDRMDAGQEQEQRRLKFTAWVRSQGVTSSQIDLATQTNMGGHYTTAASQPAIMTREHLEICRHLFVDVPQWVEQECDKRTVESRNYASREVVGQHSDTSGFGFGDHRFTFVSRNITAPATDAAKQWHGWGTALKPAWEPAILARKPLSGTVAANVLEHGTGAINVDGCRVGTEVMPAMTAGQAKIGTFARGVMVTPDRTGRWPANLIHDGSDEVRAVFPDDASRFFYTAKAAAWEREAGLDALPRHTAAELVHRTEDSAGMDNPRAGAGRTSQGRANIHPTVKPIDLMRWLCRLVTPPGGTVLDPFTGSGSTGVAAVLEGFGFLGIELDPHHVEIARGRIAAAADRRLTVQGGKVAASDVPDAQMRLL